MADPVNVRGDTWICRVFINKAPDGTKVRHRKQVRFEADGIRRARVEAAKIEARIEAEYYATFDPPTGLTVAQAAEDWWQLWLQRKKSPTTRRSYRAIIDNHILTAPFAHWQVIDVSTGDMDDWYGSLKVEPATVRRIHAVLRQIFNQCIRKRVLDHNPTILAYKPEATPKDKPRLLDEVLEFILAAAGKRDPMRERALTFAALTGLRRGEMCGMRWQPEDYEQGMLLVELNVVIAHSRFTDGAVVQDETGRRSELVVKDPKAHQVAAIALGPRERELLEEQMTWQASLGAEFGGTAGRPFVWAIQPPWTQPLYPDTLSKWFSQAAKDAHVKGFSLHDLRHRQASTMLEDGFTVEEVRARLRHKSITTTMGYLHDDFTRQRQFVARQRQLGLPAPPAP